MDTEAGQAWVRPGQRVGQSKIWILWKTKAYLTVHKAGLTLPAPERRHDHIAAIIRATLQVMARRSSVTPRLRPVLHISQVL
jgi:hypothetical protein